MNELNVQTLDRIAELVAMKPVINNPDAGDGATPFVVIPNASKVESLEKYFAPQRIKQVVLLLDGGSFIAYVNRYQTDQTLIFADLKADGASFLAVLDYHGAAPELLPQHIAHLARFETVQSPDFKILLAANKTRMTQVDFATWLEDNLRIFTNPAGAALLELVQTLFGKADVRFDAAVRLQSGGGRLHYDEDVELAGQNSTRDGTIELPKEITATVPLFEGGAAYVIRARFKYRIEGRKLQLWFEIIALHEIVRHAVLALVKQVASPRQKPAGDNGEELFAPGTGIMPLLGKLT